EVTFGVGQLLGHAECRAAREDRHFGDRVGVFGQGGDKSVAGLVNGDGVFLLGKQRVGGVAAAQKQTVPGRVEVVGRKDVALGTDGVDGRFVDQVGEVSTGG